LLFTVFHVFPLRAIGHYASTVRSKVHPEENLMNRYLRSCATRGAGFTASRVSIDIDTGGVAEVHTDDGSVTESDDPHPLVRMDARNSMVDEARIIWPKVNSRNTKGRVDVAAEVALDQLQKMLGPAICEEYRGRSPAFTLRPMHSDVRKGLWLLGRKEREDTRSTSKTISSWFSIPSVHVPHYAVPVRPAYDRGMFSNRHLEVNPILYGRIHSFVEVIVPTWRPEPFRLAKGLFYAGDHCERYTRFHCVDTLAPLVSLAGVLLEYVQVKDILGSVAVAPILSSSDRLFILPIAL
jgi:hypothetical protein